MATEKHSPLDQFKIQSYLDLEVAGYDLSFTNSSLFMLLSVALVTLFMTVGMSKRSMIPGRWQSMAEISYEFIASMLKENVGNEGRKFFPFLFTIFMFILFSNILGLIPFSFTATSHIAVTFALALVVFIMMVAVGFIKHGLGFLKFFAPSGIPAWLYPLLIPTEIISFLARPVSLSIRLAAAMTAGHILLKVCAGFIIMLGSAGIFGAIAGVAIPLPILVALIGLELFVAFLQAYIFAILTSFYLHDAIHMH
ncbi:MAG: F0F1 ATP synthase subunit A [Alphaproteobacteria bacterium CG11_big_fil_rev_8_21_14_0_20_44_7]|nr:MAG: F0F1 ATP synthase subunit A [Alphaproteobacteria bacterium CG11_big_fil_rev_8_21_14_0_20_44_7]